MTRNSTYYKRNKRKVLKQQKLYRTANPQYIRSYRIKNRKKINVVRYQNFLRNKTRLYKANKIRRTTDSLFKLSCNIRGLIYKSFKRKYTPKARRTISILGCSFDTFKQHLEKQFTNLMNWDNFGSYWELDHIKPVSLAITQKQLYKLNHYLNFQPLTVIENRQKGNSYKWIP